MPDNEKLVPNPSTFKQVLENMRSIQNLAKELDQLDDGLVETVKKINDQLNTVTNQIKELDKKTDELTDKTDALDKVVTESPETGDIVTTDDGVKVIGVHVNTENSDVDTTINKYVQGVTWEFKKAAVIGLTGKVGVVDPYVAVMTVKRDTPLEGEPENLDTTSFQVAYGSEGLNMYRRVALSDTAWGDWSGLDIDTETKHQIVESPTQPTDQQEGEYWAEPIE